MAAYDANLRVWRGDTEGGDLQDYTVEVNDGEVVLDIIHRIQATQAPDGSWLGGYGNALPMEGRLKIARVAAPELKDANFMSIADRSILACWGVKGGKAVKRLVGFREKDALKKELEAL